MTDNQEYKVLARKYRPQKFGNLIGQESLVTILSNAIISNRVAHAYVLTGVRGVGKTTTARLIAMSINCLKLDKKQFEPCGECDSCISIQKDRNLDVIELDAASKTGVDDIREIIDNVKYKPVICTFKIYIIDEVHMLSKNAFNALLKTLEEPPEHVKFIFATTEVKKIPVTILSRCQRFDLHRIENKLLTSYLFKVAELEKIIIEKDAMALIVRAADGSVRDGLSLLDQAIANQAEKINSKLIIEMLGLADRGKIFELLESIFEGKAEKALKIYNDLHISGADIVMIFDEMLNAVHFITQIKISPTLKEDIYLPELERLKGDEIASNLTMASLGLVWQVLFKGYQELQAGFHLYQHGEMIILRLIYLYDGPGPEDLLKDYKNKNIESSKNLPLSNSDLSSQINKNKTINFKENIKSLKIISTKTNTPLISVNSYRNFVDMFYKKKEAILHTQLYNDVKVVSFKEGEVTLNIDLIKNPHFTRNVAKLISKWTGRIWQIHSSTSNVGNSLYEEDLINQQKEIEEMKNHPEIKKILSVFEGVKIHSITDIAETTAEINENEIDKNINEKEV